MTIKDIARLADVSVSTVSKILNNKDSDLSETTRKKVLNIIKEYQYTPYSKIKQGASRTYTIGVVVPRNYEYRDILVSSIEKTATLSGYHTLIYFTDTIEKEEKYIYILSNKNVEAVLLYSIDDAKSAREILNKNEIPLILLKRDIEDRISAQVYTNYEKAGYLAAMHLIDNGHNNIGLLLYNSPNSEEVCEGYIRALYENDILYDNQKVFYGQDELDAGKIGAHQLINMNVTAIICESEKIACGVYHICNTYGVLIPKDISVVSINTLGLSEVLSPKLDTVDMAIEDIGKYAVDTMLSIVESKDTSNNHIKEIDITVSKKESVSSPFTQYNAHNRKIVVVGSMNMDITINVDKIPTDGETLITNSIALLPGGKGANQAVGAGKLGGLVYAIGCIGNDNDGKIIYNSLVNNSVKTDGIKFDNTLPTGKAYINVGKNGESTIVVYPGANDNLNIHQINKYKDLFKDSEFCLLSLEISIKVVEFAINLCKKNNVKIIVKPSTIEKIEDYLLKNIDYFIPNEKELHNLVEGDLSIIQKADILFNKGVKNVIVTLGSKGCYLKNKDHSLLFEAAPFDPIDTTGAADAFISALAVFMCEGNDLVTSIKFAIYAAGISITRQGVQTSMPDRMTLEMYRMDVLNSLKVTEVDSFN